MIKIIEKIEKIKNSRNSSWSRNQENREIKNIKNSRNQDNQSSNHRRLRFSCEQSSETSCSLAEGGVRAICGISLSSAGGGVGGCSVSLFFICLFVLWGVCVCVFYCCCFYLWFCFACFCVCCFVCLGSVCFGVFFFFVCLLVLVRAYACACLHDFLSVRVCIWIECVSVYAYICIPASVYVCAWFNRAQHAHARLPPRHGMRPLFAQEQGICRAAESRR